MRDVDILLDTDLADIAVQQASTFLETLPNQFDNEKDWPISRTQLSGLRLIAANEPHRLAAFAGKQREKVKGNEQKAENARRFWQLVENLCNRNSPEWSLEKHIGDQMPDELQEQRVEPGTRLTKEEQAERKRQKTMRDTWLDEHRRHIYPRFFGRFCAHLLCELANRTRQLD